MVSFQFKGQGYDFGFRSIGLSISLSPYLQPDRSSGLPKSSRISLREQPSEVGFPPLWESNLLITNLTTSAVAMFAAVAINMLLVFDASAQVRNSLCRRHQRRKDR